MAKLSGVDIHDFGTTFKAYRREILEQVPLYGELHRFIPALASWYGASICEVPIRNVNRERGDFALRHSPAPSASSSISSPFASCCVIFRVRCTSSGPSACSACSGGSAIVAWLGAEKFLRHVPVMAVARPADDAGSGPAARWIEPARHRPARRDAGPPLPRTPPPRSLLRRPRPSLAERRA